MRVSQKITRKAKALVALSLNEEKEVDEVRVQAILKTLLTSSASSFYTRSLLKTYEHLIKAALHQTHGVLEYAGGISADEIENLSEKLKKLMGRKIKLASSENLGLIAGIRLSFADYVWENSVAHSLSFLNKI